MKQRVKVDRLDPQGMTGDIGRVARAVRQLQDVAFPEEEAATETAAAAPKGRAASKKR